MSTEEVIFRQIFDYDTWTYTYLVADPKTKEAVIIDPVYERVDRDLRIINELGLRLKYTMDTHTHADHITGAAKLRAATGAKTVVGKQAGADCADVLVEDQDCLDLGSLKIQVLNTPGHTDGCTSFYVAGKVFTGDALFIRGTGRTDFQQGSPEKLYASINKKLFTLPDETEVYPGHDYKGETVSTIYEEKNFNPRIKVGTSVEEFTEKMKNLSLSHPKKIHEAVPANVKCGKI